MDSCFLVGEIGINHNGDLNLAKELIKEAKTAGFDAVKFQKRDINVVYSQDYLNSIRESPWGTTTEQQKKGLEFEKKEYDEIDSYCKKINIEWFASAWDFQSLKFLDQYNLSVPKNWDEWISVSNTLKDNGVIGFMHGAKDSWVNYDMFIGIANELDPGVIYEAEAGNLSLIHI